MKGGRLIYAYSFTIPSPTVTVIQRETDAMTIASAKYNIQVPESDLLSYIFDAPFGDGQGAWPSTEPLLHSTEETEPCYTIDEIKNIVTHLGCGLHHLGAHGSRVCILLTLAYRTCST